VKYKLISLTLVMLLIGSITTTRILNKRIHSTIENNESRIVDISDKNNLPHFDTTNYSSIIDIYKPDLGDTFIYKGFSYFVIISNLSSDETQRVISKTISSAVDCFYNDYLGKKPDELTTIFLFKDDESYRYWAKKLFNDDDLSRFGYYKPGSKVMLMNISTGTGTLVHELTHALVRYDFPDIPAWFNEGLGSLYERCSLNNGVILGYVNWRLPALQDAIKNGKYTELSNLIKTDDDEFYGKNSDVNYSQARYFCMYMQEKELLRKFYKQFRDNYENDRTGKTDIESVFGEKISDIDREFVAWVKTLNYKE